MKIENAHNFCYICSMHLPSKNRLLNITLTFMTSFSVAEPIFVFAAITKQFVQKSEEVADSHTSMSSVTLSWRGLTPKIVLASLFLRVISHVLTSLGPSSFVFVLGVIAEKRLFDKVTSQSCLDYTESTWSHIRKCKYNIISRLLGSSTTSGSALFVLESIVDQVLWNWKKALIVTLSNPRLHSVAADLFQKFLLWLDFNIYVGNRLQLQHQSQLDQQRRF